MTKAPNKFSAAAKDVLARLLASENLYIKHDPNARTAAFDLKGRVLIIPSWSMDLSEDVVDLFDSHEVGHALYTPPAAYAAFGPWVEPRKKYQRTAQQYINVCEDARIERLIKSKYPGLKPLYAKAYAVLATRDFFGLNGVTKITSKKWALIDRINLHFKVGHCLTIEFSEEEEKFLEALRVAETFDQVREVAREVYLLSLKKEEEKQESEKQESKDQNDSDDDAADDQNDDTEEQESGGDDDDDDDTKSDGETEEQESGQSPADSIDAEQGDDEDGQLNGAGDDDDSPAPERSLTQENFTEEQENGTKAANYDETQPESLNYGDIYLPYFDTRLGTLMDYETYRKKFLYNLVYNKVGANVLQKLTNAVLARTQQQTQTLVTEFNRRKAARTHSRTAISRSGRLDMGRLSEYRTSEHLFLNREVVHTEKSHGFCFLVDVSGSMTSGSPSTLRTVVRQLQAMLRFARAVRIPYRVYTFTDQYARTGLAVKHPMTPESMASDSTYNDNSTLRMVEIANSDATRTETQFNECLTLLEIMVHRDAKQTRYGRRTVSRPLSGCSPIAHSGTPAIEAYCAFMELCSAFAKSHANQIQNLITYYLADGDSSSYNFMRRSYDQTKTRCIDPVTRRTYHPNGTVGSINGTAPDAMAFLNRVLRDRLEVTCGGMHLHTVGILAGQYDLTVEGLRERYANPIGQSKTYDHNKAINYFDAHGFDLGITIAGQKLQELEEGAATVQQKTYTGSSSDYLAAIGDHKKASREFAIVLTESIKGGR
jgi:hypothetical protein